MANEIVVERSNNLGQRISLQSTFIHVANDGQSWSEVASPPLAAADTSWQGTDRGHALHDALRTCMLTSSLQGKPVHKGHRTGTDRRVAPAETLEWIRPHLATMGITRLADVTGLDTIGVPVVMACRPNSRALAVSQGKGSTLAAAKVSAAMESIEVYHAERIPAPLLLASQTELEGSRRLIDAGRLAAGTGVQFDPDRPLLWLEGVDLVRREPTWVPYEAVHADFRLDQPVGRRTFDTTTNGLASGNHLLEATSHALCELVERHAATLWWQLPRSRRDGTRLDLASVDDPECRRVLDTIAAAGIHTAVWNTTSEVGLPSFACEIMEDPDRAIRPLASAGGHGCHPRRGHALLRALTEAVQSRLTVIAGSRDDMFRSDYARTRDRAALRASWTAIAEGSGVVDFRSVPTHDNDTFDEDVALELTRVRDAGIEEVVVVDLTRPEFAIPVVRVLAPGLRFSGFDPARRPGGQGPAEREGDS